MRKWIIIGTLLFVILIIGGVVLSKSCGVVDIVTNPDRMVYTYEWFFNTHASILTYEAQLKVANEATDTFIKDHNNLDNYVNSTELSHLRAVAQGIENQLISTCQTYNANALNLTRGIFKDWRLPVEIYYSNGEINEIY